METRNKKLREFLYIETGVLGRMFAIQMVLYESIFLPKLLFFQSFPGKSRGKNPYS